jgi:hypothetical protein
VNALLNFGANVNDANQVKMVKISHFISADNILLMYHRKDILCYWEHQIVVTMILLKRF